MPTDASFPGVCPGGVWYADRAEAAAIEAFTEALRIPSDDARAILRDVQAVLFD